MNTAELRTVALALQQRVVAMEASITPAFNEAAAWVLDSDDVSLPLVSEVKAVLEAYEAFEKPSLLLYEEVRAVKTDVDPAIVLPPAGTIEVNWNDILEKPSTFPAAPALGIEGVGSSAPLVSQIPTENWNAATTVSFRLLATVKPWTAERLLVSLATLEGSSDYSQLLTITQTAADTIVMTQIDTIQAITLTVPVSDILDISCEFSGSNGAFNINGVGTFEAFTRPDAIYDNIEFSFESLILHSFTQRKGDALTVRPVILLDARVIENGVLPNMAAKILGSQAGNVTLSAENLLLSL